MRFNIFIITFIFLFSFFSNIHAENKVVFLDINFVLEQSNEGKKILNELEEINKKNINLIEEEALKLKEDEQKIINLKNIISEDEYKKKINLFKKDLNQFNQKKKKLSDSFEKDKQKKMDLFFSNLNVIMRKYMEQNSISLIIDKKNVIMSNNKNNISNEILDLVNNYD